MTDNDNGVDLASCRLELLVQKRVLFTQTHTHTCVLLSRGFRCVTVLREIMRFENACYMRIYDVNMITRHE